MRFELANYIYIMVKGYNIIDNSISLHAPLDPSSIIASQLYLNYNYYSNVNSFSHGVNVLCLILL